jgi:hypothetical protein
MSAHGEHPHEPKINEKEGGNHRNVRNISGTANARRDRVKDHTSEEVEAAEVVAGHPAVPPSTPRSRSPPAFPLLRHPTTLRRSTEDLDLAF